MASRLKIPMTPMATRADSTRGYEIGPGLGRLALGAALFLGLTTAVFWYQFHQIEPGQAPPRVGDLRWGYLVPILCWIPVESLASALRIWVIARVLRAELGFWTCLRAEWVNAGFAVLTPSQSGGGPGQVYMLSRAGTSVGTALTISLLSFGGTLIVLVVVGTWSLGATGLEGAGSLVLGAVWAVTGIAGALVLGVLCPGLLRAAIATGARAVWRLRGGRGDPHGSRLVGILDTYRSDVLRFLRRGTAAPAAVCGLSFAFLLARAVLPYFWLRFLGVEGGTLRQVVETQLALIFVVFFAPTPGGAGVAELASVSLMAPLVPVGFVPYYNLLWRFSTAYLAAAAGLLCFAHALLQDAGQIVRMRRTPR